jgi:hypothetical protein
MTKQQILLIDDLRNFREAPVDTELTIARTSTEGLAALELEREWDQIWLDHDLGLDRFGEPDTIMVVVDRMSELAYFNTPVRVREVLVHTSNPPGAAQMLQALTHFGYNVRVVQPERYFIV